jgi:hypothetical protein
MSRCPSWLSYRSEVSIWNRSEWYWINNSHPASLAHSSNFLNNSAISAGFR